MRRSALRPPLFPSLPRRLINQEIIDLLSTFNRRNKPTRSCATACPSFTGRTTIFWRDHPSLQNASAAPTANHSNRLTHLLQLRLNLSTTLEKCFINPLSQVHECFNGHP